MERHVSKPKLRRVNIDGFECEIDLDRWGIEREQSEQGFKYLAAQYDRLLSDYPWKWIAIFGGKIVAVEETWDEILAALDHAGIPRSTALLEHMEPGAIWI